MAQTGVGEAQQITHMRIIRAQQQKEMKTGTRQRIGVFPDPRKNGIGNYMYVKYIYIVISIYIY